MFDIKQMTFTDFPGFLDHFSKNLKMVFYYNKNSEELYCVTSFGLKTEVDEIQRDKNYAEHKLVG